MCKKCDQTTEKTSFTLEEFRKEIGDNPSFESVIKPIEDRVAKIVTRGKDADGNHLISVIYKEGMSPHGT